MKEELEGVLNALANALTKESDEKNHWWVEEIRSEYKHLDVRYPEMFSLLTSLSLDDKAETLLRQVLANVQLDNKKLHKLGFAYLHYEFITRHLKTIIVKCQGSACSSDKTRWLIDTYVHFLKSGEIPTVSEREYWHPRCGEIADWVAFIGTTYDLYYGQVEEYVKVKYKLIQCYLDEQKNNE